MKRKCYYRQNHVFLVFESYNIWRLYRRTHYITLSKDTPKHIFFLFCHLLKSFNKHWHVLIPTADGQHKDKKEQLKKACEQPFFFLFLRTSHYPHHHQEHIQKCMHLCCYILIFPELKYFSILLLLSVLFTRSLYRIRNTFTPVLLFSNIMRTKCYILEMKANYVGTTIRNPKVNHYNHSVMILRPMGWKLWLQYMLCITVQFHEFKCLE